MVEEIWIWPLSLASKWEVFSICSDDKDCWTALCAFSLSCFDLHLHLPKEFESHSLVLTLEFVQDLAYVVNLGAHLTTSKQLWKVPNVQIQSPVMYQCLTSWRRLQDVEVCPAVNVCFGVCHPKLHGSPWLWRGVCNRAWLFPFWVTCLSLHLLASPPPSIHHSPLSWVSSFPRKSTLRPQPLCHMQKWVQMFEHLLTICFWLWRCEISKSPLKDPVMKNRCLL